MSPPDNAIVLCVDEKSQIQAVPDELDADVIMDEDGTHRTPKVRAWFKRHTRFHAHFVSTHSSWLSLVERWFAELTTRQLRRSSHRSTLALEHDIREFIEVHNDEPKPYIWTKSADDILASIARYCARLHDATS